MIKLLPLLFLIFLSLPAAAQNCASNIAELKALFQNNGLPLTWKENSNKNPLTLRVKESRGELTLDLKSDRGDWAHVTGVVCEKGNDYVAKVKNIVWGPAAPGMAKATRIKEIKLKLPYPNLLKVSVSLMSFEFSPQ